MGESYEQGIEKAADEIVAHYLNVTVTTRNAKQIGVAAVEAFLSAQPTIQWCKEDQFGSQLEVIHPCEYFAEDDGTSTENCEFVEVRIVERETP